jgi:lipoprotein-anchoring transpeptidase ErfK/SrfK
LAETLQSRDRFGHIDGAHSRGRLNEKATTTDKVPTMRLRSLLTLSMIVLAACAGGAATDGETATTTRAAVTTQPPPETTTSTEAPQPDWEGFEATRASSHILAAYAHGPLDVFSRPGDVDPAMTVEATTILGTATVLGVIGEPGDGWVEVMLPVRPNGSTGWVRTDDVSFYVADSRIVVDLGERSLSYLVDGVEVLSTDVGIGSRYNETPTGEYFVTDSVTLSDPNSAWGPHAFGLSARSETITEFNGGDGIIGIHGTNNPSSIGSNISLGCVRLPNEAITALHELVPIGTRVEIRA